ncbi:MAG TPA: cyclodeaminase/cyclohydrolase family protein [Solirubrobacterales bacterium]
MTADRTPRTREDRLGALLGDLLDDLATESLSPAASSVTAMSVAFAAALTAKSARRSAPEMESAAAAAAQADSLRRRALALASLNAEAYERAIAMLSSPAGGEEPGAREGGTQGRDLEIRDALAKTSNALSSLIEVACDVCVLADLVAEQGKPGAQADAAVAATQAEAGARAAMELIEINLLSDQLEDAKRQARDALATASEATEQALAAAAL